MATARTKAAKAVPTRTRARAVAAKRPTGPRRTPASVRTVVERGPKAKKVVAFAVDWPGWSRGAASAELALETLGTYRDRYRPIAVAAGLGTEFDAQRSLRVVEDRIGPGSTDFWGISFAPSSLEDDPMDLATFERNLRLLQACWAYFDDVSVTVSPQMRKGPRGGGRDRDHIIRHTVRVESEDFAKRVGVRVPENGAIPAKGRATYREEYVEAMYSYREGELKPMRSWTLAFLVRHSAFHMMDHAWEMQDKDLTERTTATRRPRTGGAGVR
jgi:hypothetical protein